MAKEKISISEAELEIMKVLWSKTEPVTSIEIGEAVEAQNWKKTTIATFLTRLCEKGAISAKKQGKLYYYTAVLSIEEYRKSKTEGLIKSLYHGSIAELCASLFKDCQLSKEDIASLRSIFDDESGEKK